MIERVREHWGGVGGYGQVLRVALPLILSTSAHSLKMFVDSVLLSRYSSAAMAAAMQAGLMAFAAASFFVGVAGYTNTFVAQYTGAERPGRVGAAVWQGVWFSLAAGAGLLALVPLAGPIFDWAGHGEPHRSYEIVYFRIMMYGIWAMLLGTTVSGFFTGRSRTWTVFAVHGGATVLNVALDWAWIFGRWGFPEWGVAGAAWATVVSEAAATLVFMGLFLRRRNRERFSTLSAWRPERGLLGRLLRYGTPNGVQFVLEIVAFNLIVILLGRIDKVALEATAMALRINLLAFMPMIGLGITVSALVGQSLGANRPADARRTTWSAFYLSFGYMLVVALGYWIWPKLFIAPFVGGQWGEQAELVGLVVNLLAFVAFYSVFDTGNIVFAATLKGAGDTRFVMILSVGVSWLVMVAPSWLAVRYSWGPRGGLYVAWVFTTLYVCVLGVAFAIRFLRGHWEHMRVIETAPGPVLMPMQEPPAPVETM